MAGVAVEDLAANLILAALDGEDQRLLAPRLHSAHFAMGDVLFDAGDRLNHLCFPISGVISLVASTRLGALVEVSTVGREGVVGLPLFLGARDSANVRAVCQMPSEALMLSARHFAAWMDKHDRSLPSVLAAYIRLQFIEAAQSVLCNRLHRLEQRCARWLLLSHDRARADEFPSTHEFLSDMLGVRRPSVTLAVRRLRQRGLISSRRASITVEDRVGLEAASCECYAVVRDAWEQLLPQPKGWVPHRRVG